MRKTKMICTAGPSLDHDDEVMKQMMLNGMNCMRTNFSHGDHEEHKGRMDKLKRLRKETGLNIPFLLDTKGPEIRLKTFKEGSLKTREPSFYRTSLSLFNSFSFSPLPFVEIRR